MTAQEAGRTVDADTAEPVHAPDDGSAQPDDGAPHDARTAGPGVGTPPAEWPTGRLLSTAARRVERAWDAYLDQWSLTHASLPVLAVLAGAPRSQRELAAALEVTEQTVSRMLLRLERTGYVRRQANTEDRRRRVVALTDEGRTALQHLNDPRAIERLLPAGLTPADIAQLRRLLVRMLSDGES